MASKYHAFSNSKYTCLKPCSCFIQINAFGFFHSNFESKCNLVQTYKILKGRRTQNHHILLIKSSEWDIEFVDKNRQTHLLKPDDLCSDWKDIHVD